MSDGVVCVDGTIVAAREARVSALDRGFLYGDGAFEVMRTVGGVPYAFAPHLDRLAASCERLRMPAPDRTRLEADVLRAIEASGLDECYLRIVVTRGGGPIGIDPAAADRPSVLVYALPLRLPPASIYEQGIAVSLVYGPREPVLGAAKSGNYLAAVLAVGEARTRGTNDAVFCGIGGEILEGATSNVFAVSDGVVRTPPLGVGVLEGITRRTVIALAESSGLRVEPSVLFPNGLYRADEVFVTSSIREVVPVVRVDDVRIGDGRPGPVTRALHAAYRARLQAVAV